MDPTTVIERRPERNKIMSEVNYICCRWRDAITDPPEGAWEGSIKRKDGRIVTASYWERHGNYRFRDIDIEPGDKWVDVTSTPAVPVSKVQAAVDLVYSRYNSLTADAKTINGWHMGIEESLAVLNSETGITPSVIKG